MARELTKKQKGFVKDYIETGIGSLAVKMNYDVKDDNTARNIASDNLTKPNIVKSIQESLPDVLLAQKHLELLNKIEIIRDSEGNTYEQPETQAVSKALDMAYRLKGSYAAEKTANVNLNLDATLENRQELNAIREEFEKKLRDKLVQ